MESDFIKSVELVAEFDSYEDFKASKYFELDSISVSKLKLIKKSPLHYKEEPPKESPAFEFGKAYHNYVLEPEKFDRKFYVIDETPIIDQLIGEGSKKPRATTTFKEWHEKQIQKAEGKTLLDGSDFETIKQMSKRIKSHPYAKILLSGGIAEKFLFVSLIDKFDNQYYIKLVVDYRRNDKRLISELKSCADASVFGFRRDSAKYDYHLQAGLYSDIIEHLFSKGKRQTFFYIAQEKSAPYAFNLFSASPQYIAQGRYEYEMLLMLWNECKKLGRYDGYQVWTENRFGINELSLPPYAISELNYFIH